MDIEPIVDVGVAFERLATQRAEADVVPSAHAERAFDDLKATLLAQMSPEAFYSVLTSSQYRNLLLSIRDEIDTRARFRDGLVSASEVDYVGWVRWIHKSELQRQFGSSPYVGTMDGHEDWCYLPLTNHHRLLVLDREDYEAMKHYKVHLWFAYPCNGGASIHRKVIKRVHADRKLTRDDICDHINCNRFDARRSNLRLGTRAQNSWNRFRFKSNLTGHKGVSLYGDGSYNVEICVNGQREYIGRWTTLRDAAIAYNLVAKDRCGEFAKLDPVDMSPEDEARIRADILAKQPKPPKTAPFYGVVKRPNGGRYRADFRCKGQRYQLGTFNTAEDAGRAVDAKLLELGLQPRNHLSFS